MFEALRTMIVAVHGMMTGTVEVHGMMIMIVAVRGIVIVHGAVVVEADILETLNHYLSLK